MDDRTVAGVRWAIEWLHRRAAEINDPHARQVLDSAAFSMGNALKRARDPFQQDMSLGEMLGRDVGQQGRR